MGENNDIETYKDIKEGEKRQVNKIKREIDGVKYFEYTYVTKLKGGKIIKQTVKRKYNTTEKKQKKKEKKEQIKNDDVNKFIIEFKNQMLITLQNLIKVQFNNNITIEEIKNIN